MSGSVVETMTEPQPGMVATSLTPVTAPTTPRTAAAAPPQAPSSAVEGLSPGLETAAVVAVGAGVGAADLVPGGPEALLVALVAPPHAASDVRTRPRTSGWNATLGTAGSAQPATVG